MSLLEQAAFTLEECNRSVSVVLDRLDLDFPSPHDGCVNLYQQTVVDSG